MLSFPSPLVPKSSHRVVARLISEGWFHCPDFGFPALVQQRTPELRPFALQLLQQQGNNWLKESQLQLATLVFSIPAHEFQVHPHLKAVLEQLEVEGKIEIQRLMLASERRERQYERIVRLRGNAM